jgi:glycine/D-amino acid oxidase-like deaminating enzyme
MAFWANTADAVRLAADERRRNEEATGGGGLGRLQGGEADCQANGEAEGQGGRASQAERVALDAEHGGNRRRPERRRRSPSLLAQEEVRRRRAVPRELTSDTVVVGGGIAGLSVARFLAERGDRVVLVERGGIGAGASGRNGGFLFRQPAAWINDHVEESVAIYAALQNDVSLPLDLQRRPQLVLAVEPEELDAARAYAKAVGGEEFDLRQDDWFADNLAGGYVVEGGYMVDAMSATAATAEAARRAGAILHTNCEAKRILTRGGRVGAVATDLGVLPADRVVVACGPRTRFLLRTAGLDLPISSSRGWLLETAPLERLPQYSVEQAVWPLQEEMGAMTADPTMTEVAAGETERPGLVSLLMGARPAGHCLIGTSLSRSLLEESEGPDTVQRLAERAARVSPHLREIPVVAAWSGRRAMTPDGLPVVGPVRSVEGLDVASGFSSIGMMVAPAACRRLADGTASPEHDPGRFP